MVKLYVTFGHRCARETHPCDEPVEEVQPAPEWVSMCARCLTEHGPFVYDHGTTVCEVCIGKIILVEEAVASPVDGCTSDGVRFRDRP